MAFYAIEAYLFRIILETVGYFESKAVAVVPSCVIDPFERQKLREILRPDVWESLCNTLTQCHDNNNSNSNNVECVDIKDRLHFAITCDLWGNKVDLNFKPVCYHLFVRLFVCLL